MARFLNITPTYNPFTMDEMLKVPLLYDANFREVEKQYNELQDKAALLRLYAKDSPEIKAAIDKYDANMQNISDAIASGKYDNTMSNQARAMRETYRKDIIPMSVAAQQYENFMQSYLKDMDGTEIGEKPSIKWFMEHPGSTPEVIHGSAIQNQLAKLIGTYASTRQIDATNPNNWTPIMGGQYLAGWSGAGYTNEEIADYLNNPTNSNYSNINNIVNNFKQNIGYDKMTPEQKVSADSYINTAIQIGMAGNRKYERVLNKNYRTSKVGSGEQDPELLGNINAILQDIANKAGVSNQNGGYLNIHTYQNGGNITGQNINIQNILASMPLEEQTRINNIQDSAKRAGAIRTYIASQQSPAMAAAVSNVRNPLKPKKDVTQAYLQYDWQQRKQTADKQYWKEVYDNLPYKSTDGLNNTQLKQLYKYLQEKVDYYNVAQQNPISGGQPLRQDDRDITNHINNIARIPDKNEASYVLEPYVKLHNDFNSAGLFRWGNSTFDSKKFASDKDYKQSIINNSENKALEIFKQLGIQPIKGSNNQFPYSSGLRELSNKKIEEYKSRYPNGLTITSGGAYKLNPYTYDSSRDTRKSMGYYSSYNVNGQDHVVYLGEKTNRDDVLKIFQEYVNDAIDKNYNPIGRNKNSITSDSEKPKIKKVFLSADGLINGRINYMDAKGNEQMINIRDLRNTNILNIYDEWVKRLRFRYGLTDFNDKEVLTYLNNTGILATEMNDFGRSIQEIIQPSEKITDAQKLKITGQIE